MRESVDGAQGTHEGHPYGGLSEIAPTGNRTRPPPGDGFPIGLGNDGMGERWIHGSAEGGLAARHTCSRLGDDG